MKRSSKLFTIIFILGMIVTGVAGCNSEKNKPVKSKELPLVQTCEVEKTCMDERLIATGEVIAANTVTMQATVEGPIVCCPWREGDKIEQAGQKLIEIDRPLYRRETETYKAALSVARAKLADLKAGARPEEIAQAEESVRHLENCTSFTKADLDRIKSLVKSGSLSGETAEKARVDYVKCQTQLDAAKEQLAMLKTGPTKTEIAVAQAAVDEAAAKFSLAQAKLDECVLSAPFAGIITKAPVRPGDMVTPRTPLLEMMDPSSLMVRFAVPEIHVANIRQGAQSDVRLDAYPNKIFKARIERVYPELQRNTRTCLVEAKVLDSVALLPGQFARITVTIKTIDGAIVVPDKAVLSNSRGDTIVFVVIGDKASMRKVKVGLEQDQLVEIVQGLQAGEIVVSVGNEKLKDGMQVKVVRSIPHVESTPTEGGND